MKRSNFLSGLELDRAPALRSSPERLEEAWGRPGYPRRSRLEVEAPRAAGRGDDVRAPRRRRARVLPRRPGCSLERPAARRFSPSTCRRSRNRRRLWVSLRFTRVLGLREVAPLVSQSDGALLAYASGILSWHRRNSLLRARAEARLASTQGGHIRVCSSDALPRTAFSSNRPGGHHAGDGRGDGHFSEGSPSGLRGSTRRSRGSSSPEKASKKR